MKRKIKKYIQEQYDLLYGRSHNEDEKCFDEMKEDLELKKTEFGDVIRKKKRKINILYTLIGVYTVLLIVIFTCCFFNKKQYSGYEASLYDESIVEAEKYFDSDSTLLHSFIPALTLNVDVCIVNIYKFKNDMNDEFYFQIYGDFTEKSYSLCFYIEDNIYKIDNISENTIGKIELDEYIEPDKQLTIQCFSNSNLILSSSIRIIN